jgi:hypothetical protein
MKIALLLLLVSFSFLVLADIKSEDAAIVKFEKEEFLNEKNFTPKKPGTPPGLNKAFYDKIHGDSTKIKYFFVLATHYQMLRKYNTDKAFALALESKFGGKKMGEAEWQKAYDFYGGNILKESPAELKKAIETPAGSEAHFQKHLALLKAASFK